MVKKCNDTDGEMMVKRYGEMMVKRYGEMMVKRYVK